jgi:RNA polymerase sigma-70 factor (ECF subfamily)
MAAYNELSDHELFLLLKDGKHSAYEEIYDRYHAALYVHAFKRLQDKEECRDIIQALFTDLWSKREELILKGHLSGYLYTSVRNRIFNLLAKGRLKTNYIISIKEFSDQYIASTDELVRQNQLKSIIDKEIQLLPPRTREIFELSRKDHLTHRQIAEQLDISDQTVKTTINNALKILRIKLGTMFFLIF